MSQIANNNDTTGKRSESSFDYPEEFFSYFCKIDEFPEVISNESKLQTSIANSCYLSIDELNA